MVHALGRTTLAASALVAFEVASALASEVASSLEASEVASTSDNGVDVRGHNMAPCNQDLQVYDRREYRWEALAQKEEAGEEVSRRRF